MTTLRLAKLTQRKLLKIYGPDCYSYLQGLLCNDVRYLYQPELLPARQNAHSSINVMSSFMLNAQGRAICDMLLYRTPQTRSEAKFSPPGKETEPDELLIECDSSLASGLANTLYGYRVRRKISLTIQDGTSVWCLYPSVRKDAKTGSLDLIPESGATALTPQVEVIKDDFTVVCDPRLSTMGVRILANNNEEFDSLRKRLQSFIDAQIESSSLNNYTDYRLRLGLGEGVRDHPESDCLPLECNADLLGSVSFNKGCYLGQELTARIYYTGVVRKRLMPVVLDKESAFVEPGALPPVPGTDILNEAGRKIGLIRTVFRNRGIALLRHELALASEKLFHPGSNTRISVYKPPWWNQI